MFILLHVIRPILFIPVLVIFIAGGLIFGIIPGILLSIVGVMLSSALFYQLARIMPNTTRRLSKMKAKVVGQDAELSTGQIAILRLIPFIHFHLLSFLIYESSDHFRSYMESSLFTVIPMTIVYTTIGQSITSFSPMTTVILSISLVPLIFVFRKKSNGVSLREFLR